MVVVGAATVVEVVEIGRHSLALASARQSVRIERTSSLQSFLQCFFACAGRALAISTTHRIIERWRGGCMDGASVGAGRLIEAADRPSTDRRAAELAA